MLEPAGYGNAVSFGPDTRNFQDIAVRLIEDGGAVRVQDEAELQQFVRRCLTDIPAADALGRAARELVDRQRGATDKTIAALCDTDRSDSHRDQRSAA
jgi:3-deoxy-D-manno-octulosonic-acid transferase